VGGICEEEEESSCAIVVRFDTMSNSDFGEEERTRMRKMILLKEVKLITKNEKITFI
jgi:hypothetical protein